MELSRILIHKAIALWLTKAFLVNLFIHWLAKIGLVELPWAQSDAVALDKNAKRKIKQGGENEKRWNLSIIPALASRICLPDSLNASGTINLNLGGNRKTKNRKP